MCVYTMLDSTTGSLFVLSIIGRDLESVNGKLMEEIRQREAKYLMDEGGGQESVEREGSLEDKDK